MKRWIIIGILIVAAVLRTHDLSRVPPSPSLDEVTIGYNAYSILQTGKDEYGVSFPMLLRAYDDFRPALYVYLTIPFIRVMGLTVAAVRLPAVILSLVTIWAAYKIGKMIGKKYSAFGFSGEIAAVLLAVSPWHIYMSRLGHEANAGLAFITLGMYFFLQAVLFERKRSWVLSAVMFGLSLHGYQSEKIVSPLLLLVGAALYRRHLWKDRTHVLLAAVAGFVIAIPAVMATVSPEGMIRFRGTSAFSPDAPYMVAAGQRYAAARAAGNVAGQLVNGKIGTYVSVFFGNYLSHVSPVWLFTGRDREAHKVPGLGLLYPWEILLLLPGLWVLFTSSVSKKIAALVLAWVFLSPLPASVTTQSPHAMRAFTMIPGLQIIEAFGFLWIVRLFTGKGTWIPLVAMIAALIFGTMAFWQGYVVRFPAEQSDAFQYAMRDAVLYASRHESQYARVEFSHQGALYQSYMFFLYYTAFDPKAYQEMGGTVSGGYQEAHYIGSYSFGYLPERERDFSKNILYFYNADAVPGGLRTIATFANLDGKPAIAAATL